MGTISKTLLMVALGVGTTLAGTITTIGTGGSPTNVLKIDEFAVFGDMMAGMEVSVKMMDGSSDSCVWAALGVGSGGCNGTKFQVSQSGDTYTGLWRLSRIGSVNIAMIAFNGLKGGVVFDRTFGGLVGTPGSALGGDAIGGTTGDNGEATYLNPVAVKPMAPVGDVFARMVINFDFGRGIRAAYWRADTDLATPDPVPEPAAWTMLLGGVLALGVSRARRSRSL